MDNIRHIFYRTVLVFTFAGGCTGLLWPTTRAGTTTADFLTIIPDARVSSMGSSSTAVIDEASSLNWNPASLGIVSRNDVSLSTMKLNSFDDGFLEGAKLINVNASMIGADFIGSGKKGPFADAGNFGASLVYADYGSVPITEDTPDAIGSFTPRNFAFGAYYGNRFDTNEWTRNLPIGIGIKYINQSLGQYSSNGFAFDLGSALIMPQSSPMRGFTFGLSILNLGAAGAFIDESDPLPLTFRTGTAYRFFMNDVVKLMGGPGNFFRTIGEDGLLTLDVTKVLSNDFVIGTGLELRFFEMLMIRTGYEFNQDTRGFTVGTGFRYNTGAEAYSINFAWVPQRLIGDNFRLSLSYTWGLHAGSGSRDELEGSDKVKIRRRSGLSFDD
ncbi:MAG: PorV/PorQ family protein [Leptospiraceae bacterium]|nr:PorV/PorQ family protein [Leptospiraceae bacterium]